MVDHEDDLVSYYKHIRKTGKLPTEIHAQKWSSGVLKTLGTILNGSTKRALAKAIPDQLAGDLKGVFRLVYFRNPELTSREFQNQVARRSGNSDPEFALYPTLAVFGALKSMIDGDLSDKVRVALPPEIQELWHDAEPATVRN